MCQLGRKWQQAGPQEQEEEKEKQDKSEWAIKAQERNKAQWVSPAGSNTRQAHGPRNGQK